MTATSELDKVNRETIQLIKPDGTFSNYTKIDEKATSGQANIFTVQDSEGKEVVLKMYLRDKPSSLEDLELQDKGAAREIKTLILAREQGRKDIPGILDFGYVIPGFMNALPAVVMENIKGRNLDEIISSNDHNPKKEDFQKLAKNVGSVLTWAHKEASTSPIYHRDVSPSNIMVTDEGNAVLLDWSASRFGSGETLANTQIVNLYYTAPEVSTGRTISPAADVYSLAKVLQCYLLGKKEFEETFNGEPVRENFNNLNLNSNIVNALFKATEEDPKNRYSSIDDFVKALNEENSLTVVNGNELTIDRDNPKLKEAMRKQEEKDILKSYRNIGKINGMVLGVLSLYPVLKYTQNLEYALMSFLIPPILGVFGSKYLAKRKIKKLRAQEQLKLERANLEQNIKLLLPGDKKYNKEDFQKLEFNKYLRNDYYTEEGGEKILYLGQAIDLRFDGLDIRGNAMLTKYVSREKMTSRLKGLLGSKSKSYKWKELFSVQASAYPHIYFLSNKKIAREYENDFNYRGALNSALLNKKTKLSREIFDKTFDPIDEKIYQFYLNAK